jgi:hypothetical protein
MLANFEYFELLKYVHSNTKYYIHIRIARFIFDQMHILNNLPPVMGRHEDEVACTRSRLTVLLSSTNQHQSTIDQNNRTIKQQSHPLALFHLSILRRGRITASFSPRQRVSFDFEAARTVTVEMMNDMNGSANPGAPGPAYNLHRTDGPPMRTATEEALDYSSNVGSDSYYQDEAGSSVTGNAAAHLGYHDATDTVHEMHLALLYLLSNPEEFKKAVHAHPPRGATTLSEWNAEYDEDDESVITSATASATPLPFVVFADDAEVVLPQAHTASQLFGIEQVEGIELEAAAGIPALSQLFLRWLGKEKPISYRVCLPSRI